LIKHLLGLLKHTNQSIQPSQQRRATLGIRARLDVLSCGRHEQGIGDTVQFVRYAAELAKRGARVMIVAPERLAALCRRMPSIERVYLTGESLPDFDAWCPIASLPLACGTTLAGIPASIPYLTADRTKIDVWRRRLQDGCHHVGIAWSGSPQHLLDAERSIPLATLGDLILEFSGVQFVSLQSDVRPDDQVVLKDLPVLALGSELIDFEEVAGAIENLDLVITVDTSFAHLAGAMGKPVWVLLSDHPDWRWLLGRDDSPWYPTARLFRQPRPGDWLAVVAKVKAELAAYLGPAHQPEARAGA
jgi:hypothetical protein